MKYLDGENIAIGDLVWWNEGSCVGRIAKVIASAPELEEWMLSEEGVFISPDPLAKRLESAVFYPKSMFEEEGIGLLTDTEWSKWKEGKR